MDETASGHLGGTLSVGDSRTDFSEQGVSLTKQQDLVDAFALVEDIDLKVQEVFLPKGKVGRRILRDLKAWRPIPEGCIEYLFL